jgi:hypothetical protein
VKITGQTSTVIKKLKTKAIVKRVHNNQIGEGLSEAIIVDSTVSVMPRYNNTGQFFLKAC